MTFGFGTGTRPQNIRGQTYLNVFAGFWHLVRYNLDSHNITYI